MHMKRYSCVKSFFVFTFCLLIIQVMVHLSHPKDEIVVQVLKFLSALLYFGNKKAQKEICQSLWMDDYFIFHDQALSLIRQISLFGSVNFLKVLYTVLVGHTISMYIMFIDEINYFCRHVRFRSPTSSVMLASVGSLAAFRKSEEVSHTQLYWCWWFIGISSF